MAGPVATDRPAPETIAVVIPTALVPGPAGRPLAAACLASLLPAVRAAAQRASDGGPRVREAILVTQGKPLDDPVLPELVAAGVTVVQHDVLGPFNFSRKVNAGAALATSDVLYLLNDDVTVEGDDWPDFFLDILADPTVGAVGPFILNPDRTLNAAGDTFWSETIRHVDDRDLRFRDGMAELLQHDRDVSLLTAAALAVDAGALRAIGGFDDAFASTYSDCDFCLRLGASGRRLVCTPRAVVVHAESSSRDPHVPAQTLAFFRARHPATLEQDALLPPFVVPLRVRLLREALRPPRVAYRKVIRPLVPDALARRAWRAAVGRGWTR